MWLATRTRPDISAVLGICASMMVKTPRAVASHLVELWSYVWTSRRYAMSTLSLGMGLSNSVSGKDEGTQSGSGMTMRKRQEGESLEGQSVSPDHIHSYTDASFSIFNGRSRSGFMVCLVVPEGANTQFCNGLQGDKPLLRFRLARLRLAMSERIMTSILTYDAAEFLCVCRDLSTIEDTIEDR